MLETIDHIADAPQRMGKPLQLELEGLWIARRGQYSVLNRIDEERHVVEIVTIDHRATFIEVPAEADGRSRDLDSVRVTETIAHPKECEP